MKSSKIVFVLLVGLVSFVCGVEFQCEFKPGKWNAEDFFMAKSPRWDNFNQWAQKDDHIVQDVPDDVSDEELQGPKTAENYVSMCWRRKVEFTKQAVCSTEVAFTYRMAPLIVVAPELGLSKEGVPEFREHWECVLFDEGINVWHHVWEKGKPSWTLAAYGKKRFEPGKKYRLEVKVSKTGRRIIEVKCEDLVVGFEAIGLADSFFFGITACEGRNLFYDFKISAE